MWKPFTVIIMWVAVVAQFATQGFSYDKSLTFEFSMCDVYTIGNYTGGNSSYGASLKTVLTTLQNQASLSYPFYNASHGGGGGAGAETVYGQYYCSGDVGVRLCTICLRDSAQRCLENCPLAKSAIVWYRECTLSYSNRSMFSIQEESVIVWQLSKRNVSDQERFPDVYLATMNRVIKEAAYGEGFGRMAEGYGRVSGRETVYCLVQCSPDLDGEECDASLTSLMRSSWNIGRRMPAFMYAFYPNCQIMYSVSDNLSVDLSPQPQPVPGYVAGMAGQSNKHLIAVYIALPLAILSLLFATGFCMYRKNRRHFNHDTLAEITTAESLQFDISKIRSATNNFSPAFKLGQGGFGSVYKGNLENGQEIAVKRLFQKSQEGIEEFKNEVLFVAKLQHRNLVKLLGYCLTGREKLLIFEFLPNLSLDNFLNDVSKRSGLDWETRYKIILGVARGLLYLHEDSRLKIIHRDMKPQNILLDEAMNPKIADFGLAKSFNLDQSIANTDTIVGTYGYMSPEYAMTGHFSTKSDVYSFGVIILEIVSGKRNIVQENHPNLFHQTWKLWTEGNALDIIDLALNYTYSAEEALACIHIGLLCIQEEPGSRPTMAKVVSLLNGHSSSLPEPSPPLIFTFNEGGSEIKYSSVMISHEISDEQYTQDHNNKIR